MQNSKGLPKKRPRLRSNWPRNVRKLEQQFIQKWIYFFEINRLDVGNLHEIRESYNIMSLDGEFPSEEDAPGFRESIKNLLEEFRELAIRLLKCLAIALGIFYMVL